MKKTGSKFLALLLCLLMVASLMAGAFTVAAEGEEEADWGGKNVDPSLVPETNNVESVTREAKKNADGSINLVFTSDVHYDGTNNNLKFWLEQAEEDYGYFDAMGFCGDMGSAYLKGDAYWEAAGAMMDYIDAEIAEGSIGAATYTFGNHEWFLAAGGEYMTNHDSAAAKRLQRTGESVKTDDYIIYNFGASPDGGYNWMADYDQKKMYTYWKDDIEALDAYLAAAPTDIPIFILTHYPLHAWGTRVIVSAADVLSVLNKYPNVVVLWGHNHSNKDENYYRICHAGDSIVIDEEGTEVTLNFDYLAAGTTADKEYTGPTAGSVWTLNKGLVVTIGADGKLKYDYISLDGYKMEEGGPALVEFRDGVNYETISYQYVNIGEAAVAPEAPVIDGYNFVGWDYDLTNIQTPMLITANYAEIPVPVEGDFLLTDEIKDGCKYVLAAEYDGKYYALGYEDGAFVAKEVAAADATFVSTEDAAIIWATEGDYFKNTGLATDPYLYPSSSLGLLTYGSGRSFSYDAATGALYNATSKGEFAITFDGSAFGYAAKGSADAKFGLFCLKPAAAPQEFKVVNSISDGAYYLLAAEADGKLYALATDGETFSAKEIAAVGTEAIATDDASIIWLTEGDTFKNTGLSSNPYLYPSSSKGLLTYGSGRSFTYYPETGALTTSTSAGEFAITFDGSAFGFAVKGGANDGKFVLYSMEATDIPAEDPNNWEGKIDPATVPETNNVETVYRDAVKNADGSITLAFTSDVHYDGKNMNLATWLPFAEEKYGFIDAMGFCGDLGSAYVSGEAYWDIAEDVMDYVDTQVAAGKIGAVSYTYGNHEWFVGAGGEYMTWYEKPAAQRLLRNGPAIVTDDYVIYAFGASPDAGFDWNTYGYNAKHMYTMWEEDLNALDAYLATVSSDIPVFITTHYPLHIWEDRQVTLGEKIVEVLNKYPNVILLWGHNHSDKDVNYYDIRHAGDTINVYSAEDSKNGKPVTINFDYLAAGTTADKEYTGPEAGSAWTLNKGLIVTINADGTLKYDYITINGDIMEEDGPVVVAYRNNIDWEVTKTEFVEVGAAAPVPAIPEIEGYTIVGWDVDLSNIQQPTLATAYYEKIKKPIKTGAPLDAGYVYITLNEGYGNAVGKSGAPIVMYPVPYTAGMTVGEAFTKLHEMEYPEGAAGVEIGLMEGGAPFSLMLKAWGYTPAHGAMIYDENGYLANGGDEAAIPGTCYYAIAYTNSPYEPGMLMPGSCFASVGEPLTLFGQYLKFNSSTYGYDPAGVDGDVYVGTDWNDLKDTGINATEGYFDITFDQAGVYYVVVKGSAGQSAGIVTVSGANPAEGGIPASPQTGDSFPVFYFAAALFFGAAAAVVLKTGKKKD